MILLGSVPPWRQVFAFMLMPIIAMVAIYVCYTKKRADLGTEEHQILLAGFGYYFYGYALSLHTRRNNPRLWNMVFDVIRKGNVFIYKTALLMHCPMIGSPSPYLLFEDMKRMTTTRWKRPFFTYIVDIHTADGKRYWFGFKEEAARKDFMSLLQAKGVPS